MVRNAHELAISNNKTDLLVGYLIRWERPHRDLRSKWYIAKSLYDGLYFPPFLSGTGYLMSR